MKTLKTIAKCIIIIVLCTVSNLTFAQSSSPNNVYSATKFLGWLNAGDLPFRTNNITRMTLQDNTGFFGIGVTAPNNTIQVLGLINFHPTNFSTSLGYLAGSSNTSTRNTFVGNMTGNGNTIGRENTFVDLNNIL